MTDNQNKSSIGWYFLEGPDDPKLSPECELRTAKITDDSGMTIFEQKEVEVPSFWSQSATNIVASKYFFGSPGSENRESSVLHMVDRVVDQITEWGRSGGYFEEDEDVIFNCELKYALLHQHASFNSPVWFNVGTTERPQGSACFINSVEDSIDSIMDLATREANLFKWGSGTGTNFSNIRSSFEMVSGGGLASGPVSFMRGYDSFAGVVKSGGKTRRSAKMAILDAWHPDIMDFISSKSKEEEKARRLIESGYSSDFSGEAYSSVAFQNSNHSVRVTDRFMRDYETGGTYDTLSPVDGRPMETLSVKKVMRAIAESAHACGDPGIQFDTTINKWHTCQSTGRINASNPCSEFMFLDDTACNLASINLMPLYGGHKEPFDIWGLQHLVRLLITAQEIMVSHLSYPSEEIEKNSIDFRPLGLGYTNLGALLMSYGLPYDSDEARNFAAYVTSIMTAYAYLQSSLMAERIGPFGGYSDNSYYVGQVISRHRTASMSLQVDKSEKGQVDAWSKGESVRLWKSVQDAVQLNGCRNAQVTVLAPTGTISFMMDCDTTGIEPELMLLKKKKLAGGGSINIENQSVGRALSYLGYKDNDLAKIKNHIGATGSVNGCASLKREDEAVFACSLGTKNVIEPMAHVKMMAAVQPFLSGAISKTVNLPEETSVKDIEYIYHQAWLLGLKSIAVYRDNSKGSQPLVKSKQPSIQLPENSPSKRRRLPEDRKALTHKFNIGGHEGYLTVGEYDDGSPGEVFIRVAKEGSTVSGLLDGVGVLTSMALQNGIDLSTLIRKFSHTRFEPSGWTSNSNIKNATSILDYIFRWMGTKYEESDEVVLPPSVDGGLVVSETLLTGDSVLCATCGGISIRAGSCYACTSCGETTGCS